MNYLTHHFVIARQVCAHRCVRHNTYSRWKVGTRYGNRPSSSELQDRMLISKHRYVAGNLVPGVQGSKTFTKSGGNDPGTAIRALYHQNHKFYLVQKRLLPA